MEALSMNPDEILTLMDSDNRPIWQFNFEENIRVIRYFTHPNDCLEIRQLREGKDFYIPIFKTPDGCIMENFDLQHPKILIRNCGKKSSSRCQLVPVYRFRARYPSDENFPEDPDDWITLEEHEMGLDLLPRVQEDTSVKAIMAFLDDCCVLGGEVDNPVLKARYALWCIENNQIEIPAKKFKRILNEMGLSQKNNHERTWENISLSL
jgi:hypothetical protein